ncbi:MAG TPA: carboxylating nicotinate-nucleotide diphosphorylase [Dongiaceae bacterium]|nr:carboxylating nicotinate-nucleotide diphosphorylase [Dongiaceae bacterium]
MLDQQAIERAVRAALAEDIGPGDVTSDVVVPAARRAVGRFVAREPLTLCGLEVAREVFRQVDPAVRFESAAADGRGCAAGEVFATVTGTARSILTAERTALNFMQRMSGIATATRAIVARVAGSDVQIADTRKTAPGLRLLDKHAVRTGGGTNHRAGLYDAILIKDNHWRLAGGVAAAVRAARAAGRPAAGAPIEVEAGTLAEVREALEAGADAILLDNMDDRTIEAAVDLAHGRAFLEVSGGVLPDRVAALAALGVQRISIGALTHSARAVDIALEIEAA